MCMQQLTFLPASFWSGNKASQIFVTMLSWNWESIVVPGTNVASFPGSFMGEKRAWECWGIQTVDFRCMKSGGSNQIAE